MKRNTTAWLIIATLVVGAGVGFGAARLFKDDPEPRSSATPSVEEGSPSEGAVASPTPDPGPTLLDYTDSGDLGAVLIEDPDDLSGLADAPQDFQDYAAAVVRDLIDRQRAECPDIGVGMGVVRIMPQAGFATGGINACEGHASVWKRESNGWAEIIGAQEAFSCDDLRRHDVPPGLFAEPQCLDGTARGLVEYRG